MMFIKKSANSHGWVNPRDVEAIWKDHFDYYYREFDHFIFPMTIHPGKLLNSLKTCTMTELVNRCQRASTRLADARTHH
jgi:hypothetical protein